MLTEDEKLLLVASDVGPVKEFLSNALQTKSKGNAYLYNHLVQQLRTRDDPETLWRLYIALSTCANQITSRPEIYRELIQSLYTFDWTSEKKIVVSFMSLLGQLVSSNPIFLIPTLQMLIKSLISPALPNTPAAAQHIDASSEELKRLAEVQMRQEHIHRTLDMVIRLAPTALLEVYPVLEDHFPHKRFPILAHTEYVSQLLTLCVSYPTLQGKILDLIISRCLELDVDIVIEDSGEAKISADEEDNEGDDMFQLDDNISSGNAIRGISVGGIRQRVQMKIRDDVTETADKLDAMLMLVLKYIQSTYHSGPDTPSNANAGDHLDKKRRLFFQLLHAFETRVMTTYKSKFVQFILFYICELDHSLGVLFCRRLLDLFLDRRNHPLCRQSAVVYLASLIARGKFIPSDYAREYLSLVLKWTAEYVKHRGSESTMGVILPTSRIDSSIPSDVGSGADYTAFTDTRVGLSDTGRGNCVLSGVDEYGRRMATESDLSRHETFYCAVQAVCYGVCFLGISVVDSMARNPTDRGNWEAVLQCEYNPLRYCIHSVRAEFSKLALAAGLSPGRGIESAGALSESCMNSLSSTDGVANPLDTFFPFDPCLLLHVHGYIEEGYRIWNDSICTLDTEVDDGAVAENAEDDDTESMISSVASSIASMAFTYGADGMAMSFGMQPSSLASSSGIIHSGIPTAAATLGASRSDKTLGPSGKFTYDDANTSLGSSNEDAWATILREKRSRQFSVGSAGSW